MLPLMVRAVKWKKSQLRLPATGLRGWQEDETGSGSSQKTALVLAMWNLRFLRREKSSSASNILRGVNHVMRQEFNDVSNECVASIFRVEQ
jgi:hypothetical protein